MDPPVGGDNTAAALVELVRFLGLCVAAPYETTRR